jgi:hypothetical protein
MIFRFEHLELDVAAERAATSPGAHALIGLIATIGHQLNGNPARARAWAEATRGRSPDLTGAEFFRAFPFRDGAIRARLGAVLAQHGF